MPTVLRAIWLLSCLMVTGCTSLLLPLEGAGTDVSTSAKITFDKEDKNNVHIFLVHGWDPLDVGRLSDLQSHCLAQGYIHVKIVQFYEWSRVIEDVCSAKAENPQARVLLLGYSAGANSVSHIVNELHDDFQIDVERVFYLAGIMLIDTAYARPDYVGKIVHIRDGGILIPGMNLTGAENYRFRDVWHFGTPTHAGTYDLLDRELQSLANLNP